MTGAGLARGSTEVGDTAVEVRTVNGRALAVKGRLPPGCLGWEPSLERAVRARLARGTATVIVELETAGAADEPAVDADRAERAVRSLRAIAAKLDLPEPTLADVLSLPGVTVSSSPGRLSAEPPAGVKQLLEQALDALLADRRREGAATAASMREHVAVLKEGLAAAGSRAPAIVADYRERMRQRIADVLAEHGVTLQPTDLVREVAILAERIDVSEELQRIEVHLDEVLAQLQAGGEVGRKLEFLAQELLREVNTLGSKSPDAEMAHLVVAMKAAIDKLKEQALNLE